MSYDSSYESVHQEFSEQCRDRTPARIIRALAEHAVIADEAKARIDAEGTVVRTLKGDVIAHPAIRVHADATKTIAALLREWARSTVVFSDI